MLILYLYEEGSWLNALRFNISHRELSVYP